MIQVFGIPNCNSVKKGLDWLKANEQEFSFHNFKKDGVEQAQIKKWAEAVGWEALVNKKGTTWRGLDTEKQQTVIDADSAFSLLETHTSIIKRPVIEWHNGKVTLGYDEQLFKEQINVA